MTSRMSRVTPTYRYGRGGYYGGTRYYNGGTSYYYGSGFGYPYYGYYSSYWPYSYYDYGYYPYGTYGDYYPYSNTYYSGPAYGYDASTVTAVQQRLAELGYYHGLIDGVMGPFTRDAIRAYEATHHLVVDGTISGPLLDRMGLS
jgi:Putative peptidoglycan binding domain